MRWIVASLIISLACGVPVDTVTKNDAPAPQVVSEQPVAADSTNTDVKQPEKAANELAAVSTQVKDAVTEQGTRVSREDKTTITTVTTTPSSTMFSFGRFTLMNKADTRSVDTTGIADPVVIYGPMSFNGMDSVVSRGSFNGATFTAQCREARCEDGTHYKDVHVNFLVASSTGGGFDLNGKWVAVKTFEVDILSDVTVDIAEAGKYSANPVCVAYLQTENNVGYLHPRFISFTQTTATLKIEGDKQNKWRTNNDNAANAAKEVVGVVCFPAPEDGDSYTIPLESYTTQLGGDLGTDNTETTIDNSGGPAELVIVSKLGNISSGTVANHVRTTKTTLSTTKANGVASVQTRNENNPVHLRKNDDYNGYHVYFEEDDCANKANRKKINADRVAAILW